MPFSVDTVTSIVGSTMQESISFSNKNVTVRLASSIPSIIEKAVPAAAQAMYELGNEVMNESKADYVPVDTGTLRDSGQVDMEIDGSTITVILGYGGAAKDYAVIQHEDLTLHHTHGQAKFLETPMLAKAPEVQSRLFKIIGGVT